MTRVLMICPELPSPKSPGTMAPAARQMESLRQLGLELDIVDMRGIPKLKYLQLLPTIRRLARTCDLIHAHFGYCGWLARCAPRKPLVISFMGSDLLGTPKADGRLEWPSRGMVRLNRRLARAADALIVKSAEMARILHPLPVTVIPNGVDMRQFAPRERRACQSELGWNAARRQVLFPGSPANPRKNWPLAQAAVKFAGELLGAPIDLRPLHNVAPSQVPIYMNAAEVMLMTSLKEGSPNVVKEAMACNLPVIGVPVGDVHELLDGVSGCVRCGRDPLEIGEQLAGLLRRPQPSNGREVLTERKLDLESVARRVLNVYQGVLAGQLAPLKS